jgi:hypothetical protein
MEDKIYQRHYLAYESGGQRDINPCCHKNIEISILKKKGGGVHHVTVKWGTEQTVQE